MAVYTHLSETEIAHFLVRYDVGTLRRAQGIADGVENTNYRLVVEQEGVLRPLILTLYEKRVQAEDLPFFLSLMQHLHAQRIRGPLPLVARDGEMIQTLASRPAALTTFLQGKSIAAAEATPEHARQVGKALGELHKAAKGFPGQRANALGPGGWRSLYEKTKHGLNRFERGLSHRVLEELDYLENYWPQGELPVGIIHADLFPDNVFFKGGRLSGLIDFYFACTDILLYDLAIALNAWCIDEQGQWRSEHSDAMIDAYTATRYVSAAEWAMIHTLLRGAALRFLLTRAHDALFPVANAQAALKDPLEYVRKLRLHQREDSATGYPNDLR